jgi:hypothetical protein
MGAGVTLVVEFMPRETRGYGTTICAAGGASGAVAGVIRRSGVPKDFLVSWTCGPVQKSASHGLVAGEGYTVTIACP